MFSDNIKKTTAAEKTGGSPFFCSGCSQSVLLELAALEWTGMVSRVMASPKDVDTLMSRTNDYFISHGQREFAHVI